MSKCLKIKRQEIEASSQSEYLAMDQGTLPIYIYIIQLLLNSIIYAPCIFLHFILKWNFMSITKTC